MVTKGTSWGWKAVQGIVVKEIRREDLRVSIHMLGNLQV
jgi:hypothetical protein